MFILLLYPYVYLLTRVAFLGQSTRTLEASRSLGCNPWRSFFTIALPLARPGIISGVALTLYRKAWIGQGGSRVKIHPRVLLCCIKI